MNQYEKYQYDFRSYSMFKNVEVPKVAWIFIADQEHDWEHTFHMYENIGVLSFILEGENQIKIENKNFRAGRNHLTVFNPKIVRAERQSKIPFRRCRSVLPTYACRRLTGILYCPPDHTGI